MSPSRRNPTGPASPRRRSVQTGNLNGRKHGFYSCCFTANEVEAIQDMQSADLREEIAALRIIARRVLQLSMDIEDLDTSLRCLSNFSIATRRLSRLVKAQSIIQQRCSDDNFEDALRQAILEWHTR
jgi:hypothetical protein